MAADQSQPEPSEPRHRMPVPTPTAAVPPHDRSDASVRSGDAVAESSGTGQPSVLTTPDEASGSSGLAMSSSVRQLLAGLRAAIRRRVVLDGLLSSAVLVLLVFWLGALIDYVPVTLGSNETPRWLRAGLLTVMSAGVAWALLWRLGRRMLAPLGDRSLAVLIERRFPQLNNELVTVVELTDQPSADVSNPAAYRAMLRRVHDSVAEHVRGLSLNGLLNWRPVWRLGWLTVALVAFTASVALAKPAWFGLWNARFWALSDERWPRLAQLRAEGVQLQLPTFTGQMSSDRLTIPFVDRAARVPRGGSVTLQIAADTTAAQVPELCTLYYRLFDGSRGRANLRRLGNKQGDWQPFLLDGPPLVDLNGDVDFDVVGGDARLDDFQLRVVDPAVVTSMQLDLTYPSYLNASRRDRPQREQSDFRNGQRIAEGTTVVLKGEASGPLREAQYVLRIVPGNRSSAPIGLARAESLKSGDDVADAQSLARPDGSTALESEVKILSVQPQGNGFEIPLGVMRETAIIEVRALDEFGLTSDQIPRYVLNIVEDTQPEVETKLVGIGAAVTAKAILPVSGTARDDHGLARIWTTVVVNESPPVELDTQVDPDGVLSPRIDLLELSEKHGLQIAPDSTLGLVVSAADLFDLDGIKHVGSGQPFQIAVVTEDKLLVMLDRQELELRQRLDLIINELTQLRNVLRELSQPPGASANDAKSARAFRSVRAVPRLVSSFSMQRDVRAGDRNSTNQVSPPNQDSAQDSAQDAEQDAEQDAAQDAEQVKRLALLRAQQSVLQADKSQQELVGVANRVEDIRLQLINNRVDSPDRQTNLLERVIKPLRWVLQNEMEDFRSKLGQLQSASLSPQGNTVQAASAADANDRVLVALDAIIANMLDLESYSEIVDLVRGLLDEEERLLDETQKKQKQDILNLLKE